MSKISLIAAVANHNVMGLKGKMPWHLPADLRYFRQVTLGKPVVMGHRTYLSIGQPLAGRENIIISRDKQLKIDNCKVINDLSEIRHWPAAEVMVIGGGQIYQQTLPWAGRLYLTQIHTTVAGDTFFPAPDGRWTIVWSQAHDADAHNPYAYCFSILERLV
jgi:dihydrofolate reductase